MAPDPQTAAPGAAVQGKLTSVTETDALGMDKITTSTKSLADYFKDKLNARNGGVSSGTVTPASTSTSTDEDAYERPRTGIGASRMRLEIQTEEMIEEETQRVGLSKFSSLMSSSFLAATSSMTAFIPSKVEENKDATDEAVASISEVASDSETKKKHKKDKKKDKRNSKVHEEVNVVEKPEKKKLKKDKKSKGKATEDADEPLVGSEDDKLAEEEKKSAVSMDTTEGEAGKSSRKKEKRKHKSDINTADAGKSKKEKKRRRTDS